MSEQLDRIENDIKQLKENDIKQLKEMVTSLIGIVGATNRKQEEMQEEANKRHEELLSEIRDNKSDITLLANRTMRNELDIEKLKQSFFR